MLNAVQAAPLWLSERPITALVLGLLLFLGAHSARIVADPWRTRGIARLGIVKWKGLYALLSMAGFALLVRGYGQARQQPVVLWVAPLATRHIATLLTLVAFVLGTAAYWPCNAIKARLHQPMLLGVKGWRLRI